MSRRLGLAGPVPERFDAAADSKRKKRQQHQSTLTTWASTSSAPKRPKAGRADPAGDTRSVLEGLVHRRRSGARVASSASSQRSAFEPNDGWVRAGTRVPFMSRPLAPAAPPALVHADKAWQAVSGPLWAIQVVPAKGGGPTLAPSDVDAHVEALTCEAVSGFASQLGEAAAAKAAAATRFPIGGVVTHPGDGSKWLLAPPAYAQAAFPRAKVVDTVYVAPDTWRFPEPVVMTRKLWTDYPPQAPAVEAISRHVAGGVAATGTSHGIVCMPCQQGKTTVIAAAISSVYKCRTIFLTHLSRTCVPQVVREYNALLPGLLVLPLAADSRCVKGADIIVASLQLLASMIKNWERRRTGVADPLLPCAALEAAWGSAVARKPEDAAADSDGGQDDDDDDDATESDGGQDDAAEDRNAKADAMLQELFETVGCVVLDEAHHGVAKTFAYVVSRFRARHRLAVTATPYRADGLFGKLFHIFGPIIFRSFRERGESKVVSIKYEDAELAELKNRSGVLLMQAMISAQLARAGWNALVTGVAKALVETQGRRVLVVTPRRAHVVELGVQLAACLDVLRDRFPPRIVSARVFPKRIPAGVGGPEPGPGAPREDWVAWHRRRLAWQAEAATTVEKVADMVGVVTSEMDDTSRLLAYDAQVVVATFDLLKEGVSYPGWDALVLAAPIKYPEQVVGRIQCPGPTKKVPLVVDVWSPVSMFGGLFYNRLQFYKDEQMDIVHTEVNGGTTPPGQVPDAIWAKYDVPYTFLRTGGVA